MAGFSSVTVVGNTARDAELKYTPGGTAVCEITLAVNEKRKGEQVTHWFDCTLFGKTAEVAGQYVRKGQLLAIVGRLSQDNWTDRESGAKRSKVKIIADTMQMLGSRDGGGSGGSREPQWKNTGEESQDVPERKTADYFPDDDSVPF